MSRYFCRKERKTGVFADAESPATAANAGAEDHLGFQIFGGSEPPRGCKYGIMAWFLRKINKFKYNYIYKKSYFIHIMRRTWLRKLDMGYEADIKRGSNSYREWWDSSSVKVTKIKKINLINNQMLIIYVGPLRDDMRRITSNS